MWLQMVKGLGISGCRLVLEVKTAMMQVTAGLTMNAGVILVSFVHEKNSLEGIPLEDRGTREMS